MSWRRPDPGPCPTCGAPHTACTTESGPIRIDQLPARDALMAQAQSTEPPVELEAPIDEPEPFTTATYRGNRKRKP